MSASGSVSVPHARWPVTRKIWLWPMSPLKVPMAGFVVRRSSGLAWLDEPGYAHRDAAVDLRTHSPCPRGLADAIGPLACERRVSRRRQVG